MSWKEQFVAMDAASAFDDNDDMEVLERQFNAKNSGYISAPKVNFDQNVFGEENDMSSLEKNFEAKNTPEAKILTTVAANNKQKSVDDHIAAILSKYPKSNKSTDVLSIYNDDEYLRLRSDVRY